jgi:hypothetical protein
LSGLPEANLRAIGTFSEDAQIRVGKQLSTAKEGKIGKVTA